MRLFVTTVQFGDWPSPRHVGLDLVIYQLEINFRPLAII